MTLAQALTIKRQQSGTRARPVFLACAFEPLHLKTFLEAQFAKRRPDEYAVVSTAVYGDLHGALAAAASSECEAAAVVFEWGDLDPRLGLRSGTHWALSVQPDILSNCRERLAALRQSLEELSSKMPVAVAGPTLPIALLGHSAGWQSSANELALQQELAGFLAAAAAFPRVSVLRAAALDRISAPASRRDPLLELKAGFPYTVGHASALAGQLIDLLYPPPPMKGLITDLDDTLWLGIVGEAGASSVTWSLGEHAQIHGLYQQLLRHFSEMGVLLAIVSKNELSTVQEALRREDLIFPATACWPVLSDWEPKSPKVGEILRAWNIGPESVVFVDDSPMELEEVRTAFPAVTCLEFPKHSAAEAVAFFERLRDLFGKPAVNADDRVRQSSIQAGAQFGELARASDPDSFVRSLNGRVIFDAGKAPNPRLLELINKTNQFNLNGVRIPEGEWLRHLADETTFSLGTAYEDRFGPLGTIGAIAGRRCGDGLEVSSWVLSCRAFSRKIEHHMTEFLFHHYHAQFIRLAFRPTDRNLPLRQFLGSIGVDLSDPVITADRFFTASGQLPHETCLETK